MNWNRFAESYEQNHSIFKPHSSNIWFLSLICFSSIERYVTAPWYFLNLVTYVLINYEILDDDSILNGCPSINKYIYSVIGSRLLPENPLTTLKKKEVGKV